MNRYKRQFDILCKYMKRIEKSRPPFNEYIEIMSNLSCELMEVERCIFWFYDEENRKIRSLAFQDLNECEIDAFDGIIGHVIRTGEARIVNDILSDPYYNPNIEKTVGFKSYSSIFVPLKNSDNTVYGALQVINKLGGTFFDEEDMEIMIFVSLYCEEALTSFFFEEELIQTQNDIVFLLAELGESRSRETAAHVQRVSIMAERLAQLAQLSSFDVQMVKLASPLHDVGKVGIPDSVLNKPGRLTDEEYATMKGHTGIGHRIFAPMQRKLLRAADIIAYQHHERYDGKGYPEGLRGEDIHIYARITSICDVFDALANKRAYKPAWSKEEIYAEFKKERGYQFDPDLTDLFLENFETFYEILLQHPDETD